MNKINYPACFFTATNLSWKPLLASENHKQIIMNSLLFLKNDKRVIVYAFVIMAIHIHLIWQPTGVHTPKQNQHNFLKFTAQMIKFHLLKNNLILLKEIFNHEFIKNNSEVLSMRDKTTQHVYSHNLLIQIKFYSIASK